LGSGPTEDHHTTRSAHMNATNVLDVIDIAEELIAFEEMLAAQAI
jgi:histidine ammonia-lyase